MTDAVFHNSCDMIAGLNDPDLIIKDACGYAWEAYLLGRQASMSAYERKRVFDASFLEIMVFLDKVRDPDLKLKAAFTLAKLSTENAITREVGHEKILQHVDSAPDPLLRISVVRWGAVNVPHNKRNLEERYVQSWKKQYGALANILAQFKELKFVLTSDIDGNRLIKKEAIKLTREMMGRYRFKDISFGVEKELHCTEQRFVFGLN